MQKKFDFEPRWLVVIIFFIAGTFLGAIALLSWFFNGSQLLGIQKIHPTQGNYHFANPLLAIDTDRKEFLENKAMQNQVQTQIQNAKQKNLITDASIYFRDIEPGRWMGINENNKFSPGKLLSVPIMIAYFKGAESDKTLLSRKLIFTGPADPNSNLIPGNAYTIQELVREMIVNHDEVSAAGLLYDNIDNSALNEIYSDLGIDFQEVSKSTDDYISTKAYSLLFRILYNSTYLTPTYSEMALELISQAPLTDGIARSLPNDMQTAIDYHSRQFKDGSIESYNCGIAYYPKHPYLLCVVARGKNEQNVNDFFRNIGQVAYEEISRQYK